jgi:hypothetical protein
MYLSCRNAALLDRAVINNLTRKAIRRDSQSHLQLHCSTIKEALTTFADSPPNYMQFFVDTRPQMKAHTTTSIKMKLKHMLSKKCCTVYCIMYLFLFQNDNIKNNKLTIKTKVLTWPAKRTYIYMYINRYNKQTSLLNNNIFEAAADESNSSSLYNAVQLMYADNWNWCKYILKVRKHEYFFLRMLTFTTQWEVHCVEFIQYNYFETLSGLVILRQGRVNICMSWLKKFKFLWLVKHHFESFPGGMTSLCLFNNGGVNSSTG